MSRDRIRSVARVPWNQILHGRPAISDRDFLWNALRCDLLAWFLVFPRTRCQHFSVSTLGLQGPRSFPWRPPHSTAFDARRDGESGTTATCLSDTSSLLIGAKV
jgi:hypothetical protein